MRPASRTTVKSIVTAGFLRAPAVGSSSELGDALQTLVIRMAALALHEPAVPRQAAFVRLPHAVRWFRGPVWRRVAATVGFPRFTCSFTRWRVLESLPVCVWTVFPCALDKYLGMGLLGHVSVFSRPVVFRSDGRSFCSPLTCESPSRSVSLPACGFAFSNCSP